MKHLVHLSCTLIAALSLTACANRQPQRAVWNATPTTSVPQDQAQAKCDYELSQPNMRPLWDELSIMAGTPMLNTYGQQQYQRCMMAQGYRFGGMVPATGAAQ